MNRRDILYYFYRSLVFKKNIAGLVFNKKRIGPTPITLTYFVTNKCNAQCQHCFYWKELNKGNELDLREIQKIARGLNLKLIQLTGGEPTMRKDLVDICKAFNCRVILPTNGWMGNAIKDLIDKILDEKIKLAIEVSLDGFKEMHDKIRGINLFDKALEAIDVLKKMKLELSILTTISKINYSQMETFIEFVNNLGVFHRLQYVRSISDVDVPFKSDFETRENMLPSVEEMERLNEIIRKKSNIGQSIFLKNFMLKNLEIVTGIHKNKKKILECCAGTVDGIMYPNGDVSFCEFMEPFGNIRDYNYDFKALWNSDRANEIRKFIKDCFCTHSCNIDSSMMFDKNIIASL